MNKRLLSLAVASIFVLGLTGLSMAGIPDDVASTATSSSGVALITPAGLGVSLGDAGLTVTVTVRDANTDPIPGYPFQDIWLDDAGTGDISLCQGGSTADANTDASGVTTISGTIAGGGWTQSGMQVYLAGTPLAGPTLGIELNSPDINGDLVVNLVDTGDFSIIYAAPAYDFRGDYVPDGVINLGDLGEYAVHNTERCP